MDCFSQACKDFGLTISLKKTNVLGQDTAAPPVITIDDYELDAVCQFTYLGSTITDNLSLNAEDWEGSFNSHSPHGSSVDRPQAWRQRWQSIMPVRYQHIAVWQRDMDYICQAGEKAQYIPPEKPPPDPGHILAGQSDQRWCPVSCWSSQYVHPAQTKQTAMVGSCPPYGRMEDSRIPKDILYGELALGRRTTGRPHLWYKDVCVRDMKAVDIDTMSWEGLAADRIKWRSALKQHLKTGEAKLMTAAADKRERRKEGSSSIRPETTHRCGICNKDCHSHIGQFSHKRRCYNTATN